MDRDYRAAALQFKIQNPESKIGRTFGSRVASAIITLSLFHLLTLLPGCSHVENHWREDGPAKTRAWASASEADIRGHYQPPGDRDRGWTQMTVLAERGAVTHWPLWFEDPFADKGSGRNPLDEQDTGRDEYALSWEDYLAMPYGYARHTLNWLLWPASAVVTPPCTVMESDGVLSRQLLGYDHDAERYVAPSVPYAPPQPMPPASQGSGG